LVNNGYPFFIQKRPGKNERCFKIIKFRTMSNKRDGEGVLLADSARITRFGSWVRKSSIDELPQLLNVLLGDMSLIGPRPLLTEYLPLYNKSQKLRHKVRPGITGWAQINGRNTITWKQKFNFDVYYVNNVSFALDIMIIKKTIINVLRSKDITQKGEATVQNFKGNDKN
jgi:lipopolysaccharide/colanic/teichoic acid biosynthesis glycosyltransferase